MPPRSGAALIHQDAQKSNPAMAAKFTASRGGFTGQKPGGPALLDDGAQMFAIFLSKCETVIAKSHLRDHQSKQTKALYFSSALSHGALGMGKIYMVG